jgi:hypothetical protein
MSTSAAKPTGRRIAVALDASQQSLQLIALAAGVAAALRAELEGVFIEDDVMLRAFGLPFQREFRLTTRREEHADAARLQRELRAAARHVRESLGQSAQRLGCSWSFRVWRGDAEAEILSAASSADMFTLSPLGRFAPFGRRGSAARRHRGPDDLVIGVLWDGSAGAARALAAAGELAAGGHARLQVFMQAADEAAVGQLHRQMADTLGPDRDRTDIIPLAADAPEAVIAALIAGGGDLLMVDSGNPLLDRRTLWQNLAALNCPLLLVR